MNLAGCGNKIEVKRGKDSRVFACGDRVGKKKEHLYLCKTCMDAEFCVLCTKDDEGRFYAPQNPIIQEAIQYWLATSGELGELLASKPGIAFRLPDEYRPDEGFIHILGEPDPFKDVVDEPLSVLAIFPRTGEDALFETEEGAMRWLCSVGARIYPNAEIVPSIV